MAASAEECYSLRREKLERSFKTVLRVRGKNKGHGGQSGSRLDGKQLVKDETWGAHFCNN